MFSEAELDVMDHKLVAIVAIVSGRLISHLPPRHLHSVLRRISGASPAASVDLVEAARRVIVRASKRCAGRWCLERSLAIALYCRLCGRWPEFHIGVRLDPFLGHAWVAVDGRPVGESGEVAAFVPTISVLPMAVPSAD